MATTITRSQKLQKAHLRRSQKAEKEQKKRIARDLKILSLRERGKTLEEIAISVDLTHQRVGQIIKANTAKGK